MPDKSYYDPDGMSPARKEEFLRWYNDKVFQRYVFNFQDELLTYCQSDVRLLKQGCMTFQSQFKDIVNFNPMKDASQSLLPVTWHTESNGCQHIKSQ